MIKYCIHCGNILKYSEEEEISPLRKLLDEPEIEEKIAPVETRPPTAPATVTVAPTAKDWKEGFEEILYRTKQDWRVEGADWFKDQSEGKQKEIIKEVSNEVANKNVISLPKEEQAKAIREIKKNVIWKRRREEEIPLGKPGKKVRDIDIVPDKPKLGPIPSERAKGEISKRDWDMLKKRLMEEAGPPVPIVAYSDMIDIPKKTRDEFVKDGGSYTEFTQKATEEGTKEWENLWNNANEKIKKIGAGELDNIKKNILSKLDNIINHLQTSGETTTFYSSILDDLKNNFSKIHSFNALSKFIEDRKERRFNVAQYDLKKYLEADPKEAKKLFSAFRKNNGVSLILSGFLNEAKEKENKILNEAKKITLGTLSKSGIDRPDILTDVKDKLETKDNKEEIMNFIDSRMIAGIPKESKEAIENRLGMSYEAWDELWKNAIDIVNRTRTAKNVFEANAISRGEKITEEEEKGKKEFVAANNEMYLAQAKDALKDYFKKIADTRLSKWVEKNMKEIVDTIDRKEDIRDLMFYLSNTRLAYENLSVALTREERSLRSKGVYPGIMKDRAKAEKIIKDITNKAVNEVFKDIPGGIGGTTKASYKDIIVDIIKTASEYGVEDFLEANPDISEDDLLYVIGEYENG